MLEIYFDIYKLGSKWVRSLKYQANSFDNQFKLGSTICRVFELEVDKRLDLFLEESLNTKKGEEIQTDTLEFLIATSKQTLKNYIPKIITFKEDGIIKATLKVDEFSDEDNSYYKYTLTDEMVRLNKEFVYNFNANLTVKQLLEQICQEHEISLVTQNFYCDDMVISWNKEGMSERDFVGYVAEVNGGCAYINQEGNLVIEEYVKAPIHFIEAQMCSSFKVGSKHLIDRVYVELATATKYFPETTENETCFLDSENILFTDSGDYTIDGIIRHIYDSINGLEFYNIKVDKCPINENLKCGDLIAFKFNNEVYNTIVQIDYEYSHHFIGGYELQLENSTQQETKVQDNTKKALRQIKIIVDRELGIISEEIKETEDNFINTIIPLFAQTLGQEEPSLLDFKETIDTYEKGVVNWVVFKIIYKSGREHFTSKVKLDDVAYTSCENIFQIKSELFTPLVPIRQVTTNEDVKNAWTLKVPSGGKGYSYYYFSLQYQKDSVYEWNTPIYIGSYNALLDVSASLELYVKKDEGSDYISSWITGCADNIVLNAKSKLVFGDLDNQYITISNYENSNGVKVGVLFDGTGDIRMTPSGQFNIQNNVNGNIYNQLLMTQNDTAGNQFYIANNDNNAKVCNYTRLGANRKYNDNYGKSNYIAQKNYCYGDSSKTANFINLISTSDNVDESSNPSTNALFFYNYKYANNNYGNSVQLISKSTYTATYISNMRFDTNTTANYFRMFSEGAMNYLELANRQFDNENSIANYLNFSSTGTYNGLYIENYDLNSKKEGNSLKLMSSSNNNVYLSNMAKGNSGNEIGNRITLTASTVSQNGERSIKIENYNNDDPTVVSNSFSMYKQDKKNDITLYCFSQDRYMSYMKMSTFDDFEIKTRDRKDHSHNLVIGTLDYDGNYKNGVMINGHRLYFENGYVRY